MTTDLSNKSVEELLKETVSYEQWDHKIETHLDMEAAIELTRHLEEAQQKIAERDAALARCVEALRELRIVAHTAGGIPLKAMFDDLLASLPTSAQATAKVLAAARELCKFTTYEPDGSWPELNRLREAIREEQEGK